MKFLKQFSIILFLSFLGEALHQVIPLPVPASVYGLALMLGALGTGILKLSQVREVSGFLIEIMPVMFIPAGAGLMNSWPALKMIFVPVIIITILTTILVMAVTGKVTQGVIRKGREKNERISD